MSESSVLQDYDDGILVVTLNRPRKRNAFDDPQWPVKSLQATKRILQVTHEAAIQAARRAEDDGMALRAGSPENREAVTAFLQKRDPDFRQFRKRE